MGQHNWYQSIILKWKYHGGFCFWLVVGIFLIWCCWSRSINKWGHVNSKIKTAKKTFSQGLFLLLFSLCFRLLVNASTRSPNTSLVLKIQPWLKENQFKSLPSQSAKSRKNKKQKKTRIYSRLMNEGHNDLVISQRQSWRNMLISLLCTASLLQLRNLFSSTHLIPMICISG